MTVAKFNMRTVAGRRRVADAILEEVATTHKMSVASIRSDARHREFVAARRAAARKLDKQGLSLNEIGAALNRDHTTACYYIRPATRAQKVRRYAAIKEERASA